MLHFTCDLCGKELQPGEDQRYVVKMETFAAQDPAEITEADLDEDHMEAVSKLLRDETEHGLEPELVEASKNLRFDMCQECYQKFLRDPLGREHVQKLYFSQN
jgi:hypothetical protein